MIASIKNGEFMKRLIFFVVVILAVIGCSSDSAAPAEPAASAPQAPTAAAPAAPTAAPPAAPTAAPAAAPTSPPATVAPAEVEPVEVVTTTNIVADWVRIIGGERVNVLSLLPAGADPHAYQPGAQDVAAIADADVVLSIGLGLEESWLHELMENAARDESAIVELAEIVDPIEFGETHAEDVEILEEISDVVHEVEEGEISAEEGLMEIKEAIEIAEAMAEEEEEEEGHHEEEEEEEEVGGMHLDEMVLDIIAQAEAGQFDAEEAIEEIEHLTEEGEEEHEGHGHELEDPHFWFDPIRVKLVVNDIAARLAVLDPEGRDGFTANATAYNAELDELHAWTQEQVAVVPDDRRYLVTSHDSLGYFADLYGFEVVGVILSTTTEVDPSPADLAELTHEVEEYGVPAIFGETTVSERLAMSVATESGADLVRLHSGSLGTEGSGAETYIKMIRTNVERIVGALK